MALTGNFDYIIDVPSETDFVSSSVSYPANLDEDHPNYEQRGTTEVVLIPTQTTQTTSYSNIYLIINSISIETSLAADEDGNFANERNAHLNIRIYDSEAAKNSNPETFQADYNYIYENINHVGNLYELSYEYLKTQNGFENLTNA